MKEGSDNVAVFFGILKGLEGITLCKDRDFQNS